MRTVSWTLPLCSCCLYFTFASDLSVIKPTYRRDGELRVTTPSRSSKVSKDSDCSLVSSKNYSEILPHNGWRPGPGQMGQGGLKVVHLWRHSQKHRTPQAKTCRVFWRFDQVRDPYRSGDIPAQSHVRLGVFSENPRKQPDAKVFNYNCIYCAKSLIK